VVSPIGIGVSAFWKAALAGRSGVSALSDVEGFAIERYRCRVAARVRDFVPSEHLEASAADRLDRHAQFALVAAQEAVRDADLRMDRVAQERVGVVVGAGMGAMTFGERELTKLHEGQRPDRVHPNFIPTITMNSASGLIALAQHARGPNLTVSTACSSGAHALGLSLGLLRAGQADAIIAVGTEATITPLAFAGFASLRALSTSFSDAPERASRPFDRARDGFVMGEGAGALVVETLAHARRRRARIYAELAGYAATSEAYHMVIPKEDGRESARTMQLALDDAAIAPGRVDYINAHATATPVGDPVEIRAIRHVLRRRAERVVISATKSLVGHTLGAAGALGAITCVLSLGSGQVHPTINYDDPDPECALPGISNQAQERPLRVALLNAFGFGSNNASLVLTTFSGRLRP
jgi:3-oxoacyl-[acyl-carrier-protein] synthase II